MKPIEAITAIGMILFWGWCYIYAFKKKDNTEKTSSVTRIQDTRKEQL